MILSGLKAMRLGDHSLRVFESVSLRTLAPVLALFFLTNLKYFPAVIFTVHSLIFDTSALALDNHVNTFRYKPY